MQIFKSLMLVAIPLSLSSCSVFMAANKKGVDINELTACKTRGCVQGKGASLVSSMDGPSGTLIETYNVRKPTGSAGRAVMHGVLDVATLGIWEVAGTPIEGVQNKEEFVALQVTSDKTSGNISKIEVPQ